jgi:ABC-type nitrate/sulfonate/bicarbonate transport system substrate-binding protein
MSLRTLAIALLLVSATGASPCMAQAKPALDEVSFVSDREFDSASIIYAVAEERGFLADAKIRLVPISAGPSILPATGALPVRLNGELVFAGRHRLYRIEAQQPGQLKIFGINAQDQKKWNEAILVRRSLKVDSFEKLPERTKFGLAGGRGTSETLVDLTLKEANLPRERFTFENISEHPLSAYQGSQAGLLSGINALYAREPYLSTIMASGEWAALLDAPWYATHILSPWPLTMSAFDKHFLTSRPEVAKRLLQALERAQVFVNEHPDDADAIFTAYLKKKTGVSVTVRRVSFLRYDQVAPEILQKQADWYFTQGLLTGKINSGEMLFNDKLLPQ